MTLNCLHVLLAIGSPPAAPGTQPNPQGEMVKMVGMMLLMGVVFYFMLIRPQRLRTKQQESLLGKLKAGDKVLTSSGIVGVVVNVKEKTVSIRSADTKLEILKSAVSEITERAGESSESKP